MDNARDHCRGFNHHHGDFVGLPFFRGIYDPQKQSVEANWGNAQSAITRNGLYDHPLLIA